MKGLVKFSQLKYYENFFKILFSVSSVRNGARLHNSHDREQSHIQSYSVGFSAIREWARSREPRLKMA